MILTGAARLAGVMGWPIAHSRSPRIHGYWLEEKGIDGAYLPLAVRPEALGAALAALPALGFRGCNLTAPHKETALDHMASLSATARRIGAVNTVTVGDDGALHGDNTDGFGFISHLRQEAPAWDPARRWRCSAPAARRARSWMRFAAEGLRKSAWPTGRRSARRRSPRQPAISVRPLPWDERAAALEGCGLLVNTTQLGQVGKPALDLDLGGCRLDAVVYDLVYAPLETDLLKAARARGHATVDGLGMLLHQARAGLRRLVRGRGRGNGGAARLRRRRALTGSGRGRPRAHRLHRHGQDDRGGRAQGRVALRSIDADAAVHRLLAPGGERGGSQCLARFPDAAAGEGDMRARSTGVRSALRSSRTLKRWPTWRRSCILGCAPASGAFSRPASAGAAGSPCWIFRCSSRPAERPAATPPWWSRRLRSCSVRGCWGGRA